MIILPKSSTRQQRLFWSFGDNETFSVQNEQKTMKGVRKINLTDHQLTKLLAFKQKKQERYTLCHLPETMLHHHMATEAKIHKVRTCHESIGLFPLYDNDKEIWYWDQLISDKTKKSQKNEITTETKNLAISQSYIWLESRNHCTMPLDDTTQKKIIRTALEPGRESSAQPHISWRLKIKRIWQQKKLKTLNKYLNAEGKGFEWPTALASYTALEMSLPIALITRTNSRLSVNTKRTSYFQDPILSHSETNVFFWKYLQTL